LVPAAYGSTSASTRSSTASRPAPCSGGAPPSRSRISAGLAWCNTGSASGPGGLDGVRAVQQRLAAQPPGDTAGFAGRRPRGLVIVGVEQVLGVVEQAMGEVVRSGVLLAQPGDRGRERRSATGPAAVAGRARAAAAVLGAVPASACPQARQKRLLGAAGSPHAGHTTAGAPHSTQNRSPAARPAPHPPHVITRQQ